MAKRRVSSPDPPTRHPTAAQPAAIEPTARSTTESTTGPGAVRQSGDGRTVVVRVRPGAGRTRVGGRYQGPHGPALIVAVRAPAVDGKATAAVRQALADALRVRPRDVALKLGATSRDKVFTVSGDVGERLAALRDGSA